MGLFFNSDTQNKKDQILKDIKIVNNALKKAIIMLDNEGTNATTLTFYCNSIANVESNLMRIASTSQSMSVSQSTSIMVPWVNGNNISLMAWRLSFHEINTQIGEECKRFI